jgi:hypothetical protein
MCAAAAAAPTPGPAPPGIPVIQLTALIGRSHLSPEVQAVRKRLRERPAVHQFYKYDEAFHQTWRVNGLGLAFDREGKLDAIHLYDGRADGCERYEGELPEGLTFADDMRAVERKLGRPPGEILGGNTPHIGCTWEYPAKGLSVNFRTSDAKDQDATIDRVVIWKPEVEAPAGKDAPQPPKPAAPAALVPKPVGPPPPEVPLAGLIGRHHMEPKVCRALDGLRHEITARYPDGGKVFFLDARRVGVSLECDANGRVIQLHFYNELTDGFGKYRGKLPGGLEFGSVGAVVQAFGEPASVTGDKRTPCRWHYPDKGLVIRTDRTDLRDRENSQVAEVVLSARTAK